MLYYEWKIKIKNEYIGVPVTVTMLMVTGIITNYVEIY